MTNRKEIITALQNIGCSKRWPDDDKDTSWILKGYPISIKEDVTLTDVFKILMRASEELKIWEIKSVLQII